MRVGFSTSYVALWVLVIFQTIVAIRLFRQIIELRRRIWAAGLSTGQRLPLGSPAPKFSAKDLESGWYLGSEFLDRSTGVILFLSPNCSLCKGLADSLRPLARDDLVRILAVCEGEEKDCRIFLKRLGPNAPVLLDRDGQVGMLYHVSVFPTAVVVNTDGAVGGYGHPKDSRDLRDMLSPVLSSSAFDLRGVEVDRPNPPGGVA